MTPAPFELPLKASEAAMLADITFQLLENRRMQEDLRNRLASRASGLGLTSVRPYWGSLQQDPVHASTYYLAVDALPPDGAAPTPLLLRMALASAPASALFPKAMLIGRMRPGGGREVVVNAAAFGPADMEAIDTFATKVDRAFLPRPQASTPAITVISMKPDRELPAAFDGFRLVQKATGINTASIAARTGTGARTLAATVWSAIRAGWREGYGIEAEPIARDCVDLEVAVREQAVFTRFRVVLGEIPGATPPTADIVDWAAGEFGRRFSIGDAAYQFEPPEVQALIERHGSTLTAAEKFYDTVRRERMAAGHGRVFDFEIVLPLDSGVRDALFCQYWLKARGRAATLIAPPLPDIEEAKQQSSVARHFGSSLSFDAEALDYLPNPAQWTGGRWNCRVMGGDITAARIQAVAAALRS